MGVGRSVRVLVAVGVLVAVVVPGEVSATEGPWEISSDTTLTEDHHGPISIVADGVTLDCAGHRVVGRGFGVENDEVGISVENRFGVTVENCEVSEFGLGGIVALESEGLTIRHNAAADNWDCPGFALYRTSDSVLMANRSTGNGREGFYLLESSGNTLSGNVADFSFLEGFHVDRSHDNTITGNTATQNYNGIRLLNAWRNEVVGNDAFANDNLGLHDLKTEAIGIEDYSTYSDNYCLGNPSGRYSEFIGSAGGASDPAGLCTRGYAGATRYGTAAAISASQFEPGVDVVYVATGTNFPDALAGGPIAGLDQAPVLLMGSLPSETRAELKRLKPKGIVILGGTGVISAADEALLASYTSGSVERLAGLDRYATAAAISKSRFSPGVPVAYVATGANFPDALAGSPVAAINGGPILLVAADSIPTATARELNRLAPNKIVILGGTAVVSPGVEAQLDAYTTGAVQRLAGLDRYATAAAISKSQFSPGVDVVYVATGDNFPDALAGGPVAAINEGPILLVTQTGVPTATARELARLDPKRIIILGGPGAVSPDIEIDLAMHIKSP